MLDYYGLDIVVDRKIKKFYELTFFSKGTITSRDYDEIMKIYHKSTSSMFISVALSTSLSDQMAFAFSIDLESYFHDLQTDSI